MDTPREAGARPWWREELRYLVELVALTGLVLAQPLLDVFGRSPETFAYRSVSSRQIVVFGLLVVLVPPLLLEAGSILSRLFGSRTRRLVQAGVLGVLVAMLAISVGKQVFGVEGPLLGVLAVAGGVLFAVGYLRLEPLRMWTAVLAVAPAVFLLLFLGASPTSKLVSVSAVASPSVTTSGAIPDHVVMLLLDEFPTSTFVTADGEIDERLFPNLAGLSRESTWYRGYSTNSTTTVFAVPSLLAGTMPDEGLGPVTADHPRNVFTLFSGIYDLAVDETMTRLCPPSLCDTTSVDVRTGGLRAITQDAVSVLRTRFSLETTSDPIAASVTEATAGAVRSARESRTIPDFFDPGIFNSPVRFDEFVNDIDADKDPTFHFLHLLAPHQPWKTYPDGQQYAVPEAEDELGRSSPGVWDLSDPPAQLGRQRHLLQAMYTDELIGRLIGRLKNAGMWDNTLLVVAADHGITFEAGAALRAETDEIPTETWSDIVFPPLFIKSPGQQTGSVNDWNVQSIDILPTIADLANVTLPWQVDGRSAAHGPPRTTDRRSYYKAGALSGTVLGPLLEVSGSEGERRIRARSIEHFAGGGDRDWAPYAIGASGDLVGHPVKTASLGDTSEWSAALDDPSAYDDVDPDAPMIPGLLLGHLTASTDSNELRVAVALNGTVAAVTTPFRDGDDAHRLAVILPNQLFRAGTNRIELYEIDGTGSTATLKPIRLVS